MTALVGVGFDPQTGYKVVSLPSTPSFTWTDTFNGLTENFLDFGTGGITCTGGVTCTVLSNHYAAVPESGTGGVTITSISGVQLPTAVNPSDVTTTASGLAYSRVSKTFNGTVTLTNPSSDAISGPVQVLFMGMPAGVTLVNATGDLSGTPYLTVPAGGTLAPGQSVTVNVQFKNPSNATINFTPAIYSGSIN